MRGDIDKLTLFLQEYEQYISAVLKPTQLEIRAILDHWQRPSYWEKYKQTNRIPIPTPVNLAASRIKRPEQVVDKIFRKAWLFPDGLSTTSFRSMHDAIGVRVNVYFLSHLPLIDRELRSSPQLEISRQEPPTAYLCADEVKLLSLEHLQQVEKESGYRALHYTLRLTSSSVPVDQRPWFELQVRTLSQELWSVLEHHLGYKPGTRTNVTAQQQFRILSKLICAIDEHFNLLYDELNRFQQEASYQAEDELSAENLPSVLAEVGVSCTERDINNILRLLYSRGVTCVGEIRSLATANRLAIIRNTYLSVTGRSPWNLEVIATLAALKGAADDTEVVSRIKSQIEYRGTWDSLRQDLDPTM